MDLKEEEILGTAVSRHWYYVSKGKAIQKLLELVPVKGILDVGAGSGVFSRLLLDINVATSALCVDTGYDFNDKSEIHNGKTIRFVKGVDKIDESLILMIDVLEHIEDDFAVLKYYVDKMPVGGHILISVPAFNFLWSGHDVFLEHKRRYTLSELETLVENCGLHVEQGRYFFGLLFPVIALIRLSKKILLKAGKLSAKSDLSIPNNFINKLLVFIHALELRTLFSVNRVAGLSAFCLAKKIQSPVL